VGHSTGQVVASQEIRLSTIVIQRWFDFTLGTSLWWKLKKIMGEKPNASLTARRGDCPVGLLLYRFF
jgi:hypothetical protein